VDLSGKKAIAIIGNGIAAVECVKALRQSGDDREIHVFGAGSLPPYNPMLTSYYAAGKIEYATMFPYGDSQGIFTDHGVILHLGAPVTKLSVKERTVTNAQGFTLSFDQCLIASGASPFIPPFPGSDGKNIYPMRTAEDAIRLKAALEKKPKKALVVGASMVGIKLVELFHHLGVAVCLADMAPRIFPLAAHPDCAAIIEERLRSMGVALRFSAGIEGVEARPEGGIQARFSDGGPPEEADLLMACIGVRANTGFIDRTEIEARQGILVDRYQRTSAPGVFAAGDCCMGLNLLTGESQVIGLLANARKQGRIAGLNMAGQEAAYTGEIPHNITHFMGMDFIGIGEVKDYTREEKRCDSTHYAQFFYRGDTLCGANMLDNLEDCGVIKNELVKQLL
jgi:3-phenylpropionate/trans-cinnamate dioxygenase ferredoxin reductase subunit